MKLTKFQLWLCILFTSCTYHISWAQLNEGESIRAVGSSLNKFAFDFLHRTLEQAGDSINIALSPYTVWTLLAIISEGARGVTAQELENVLGISSNRSSFQFGYKALTKYLNERAESTQLDLSNAIFTTADHDLNRPFQKDVQDNYRVDVISTDFNKPNEAVAYINSYVANATNGRTKNFVTSDDVNEAVILMVSTLYFKGEWKIPFNESLTIDKEFYSYNGTPKGQVKMMFQRGAFRYTYLQAPLKGHAVELPYGKSGKFSMVVMLPRKGQKLSDFLESLKNIGLKYVLDLLSRSNPDDEDGVEVHLPRFSVNSDLNLNAVLTSMGISDMFNAETANLLGMFPHYLSVTKVIQKAKIEVNEKGTVLESVAGAELSNRTPPPKFLANRDFAYFIYENSTKSIIFTGTFTNPNTPSGAKQ